MSRDLKIIDTLLAAFEENPLKEKDSTHVEIIRNVFEQQNYMRKNKMQTVVERIVSIHQPHYRPIVRGKAKAKVELESNINVRLLDG